MADDPSKKETDPKSTSIAEGMRRSREFARTVRLWDRVLPAAFLLGIALDLLWQGLFAAPASFTAPALVKIVPGGSVEAVAQEMQAARVVRSAALLRLILRASGKSGSIEAGSYFFSGPENVITVARRLAESDFELTPVRVTVAEGDSVGDIAAILDKKLAPFDQNQFIVVALPHEGYLYPDTYYFTPGEDPSEVADAMEENFQNHTARIESDISAFGKPLGDDVTMASILVGEAATDRDRRTVAGILWKRLKIGMPLQVDATFGYILQKNLTQLTAADIATDSPYNTYKNKGLPPTPIGSPGAEAVEQAVTPLKTNYLYYLSDKDGVMHYSATYAGQLANIKKYYGK